MNITEPSLASKTSRIFAVMIDWSILAVLSLIFGILFGERLTDTETFGYKFSGLPAFFFMLIIYALIPLSEGLTGQTLGKRAMKIKVVRTNFTEIDVVRSTVRAMFGFFDMILFMGLFVASLNKKKQRIGDLVADTCVIKVN